MELLIVRDIDQEPEVEIDFELCSPQVEVLCEDFEYHQQVKQLWADTADDPGPRLLKTRDYAYLVTLYYAVQTRTKTEGKPMSDEFYDLTAFCRYVGPRPTAAHSLHRLNNGVGYRIGNLEWANKRKQSEFRRNAQHHLYMGRRLTDRQIAELLALKGVHITQGTVKKSRQRLMKKGVAPAEVTRLLFKKHGLPYESSDDPVEAWDFPENFSQKLVPAYQNFRQAGESRIEFFIRWLRRESYQLERLSGSSFTAWHKSKLMEGAAYYTAELHRAETKLEMLHGKKAELAIHEIVPRPESLASLAPATSFGKLAEPTPNYAIAPSAADEPYTPPAGELLITFARFYPELRELILKTPSKYPFWRRKPVECLVFAMTLKSPEWLETLRSAPRCLISERAKHSGPMPFASLS